MVSLFVYFLLFIFEGCDVEGGGGGGVQKEEIDEENMSTYTDVPVFRLQLRFLFQFRISHEDMLKRASWFDIRFIDFFFFSFFK